MIQTNTIKKGDETDVKNSKRSPPVRSAVLPAYVVGLRTIRARLLGGRSLFGGQFTRGHGKAMGGSYDPLVWSVCAPQDRLPYVPLCLPWGQFGGAPSPQKTVIKKSPHKGSLF